MFEVIMVINWQPYRYGVYNDQNKANEIALQITMERNIYTEVHEIEA